LLLAGAAAGGRPLAAAAPGRGRAFAPALWFFVNDVAMLLTWSAGRQPASKKGRGG